MSITSYVRQATSTKKSPNPASRIFTWNESADANTLRLVRLRRTRRA